MFFIFFYYTCMEFHIIIWSYMRIISLLLSFCAIVLLPCTLFAQTKLTKEEAKKLQNELKTLAKNPQKLKSAKIELEELSVTENMRNAQTLDLQAKIKKQENELKSLEEDINNQKVELNKMSIALQAPQKVKVNKIPTNARAIYRVQIGAYRNAEIAQTLQSTDNFEIEPIESENGMKRYLVGKFTSFQEANKLVQKLRKTGAQAFAVGYLDGKRLGNLKEMPVEFMQK